MQSKLASTALTLALTLAMALALTLAPAAHAAPSDACALASPAQISQVLGVNVGPGEHMTPTSTTLCAFGQPGPQKHVVLAIITPQMFAYEKHPLQGIKEEVLNGVGDEAHYMTTPGFGTGLSVRHGNFVFKVRVYGFPPADVEAREKTLALEILAKL